jgi:hypothetical protein
MQCSMTSRLHCIVHLLCCVTCTVRYIKGINFQRVIKSNSIQFLNNTTLCFGGYARTIQNYPNRGAVFLRPRFTHSLLSSLTPSSRPHSSGLTHEQPRTPSDLLPPQNNLVLSHSPNIQKNPNWGGRDGQKNNRSRTGKGRATGRAREWVEPLFFKNR